MVFSEYVSLNDNDSKCSFVIKDLGVGVVNAIRRVILSEVPNIAVGFDVYHPDKNDTKFIANTSSLHNEFLGHRLSLIPIHVPADVIDNYDSDRYIFTINEHNNGTEPMLVTTEHINVRTGGHDGGRELTRDEVRTMFPPDAITGDYIIIAKLKPNLYAPENGERLHVEFWARKGIARTNAAWGPVSLCSYTFVIDPAAAKAALKEKLDAIDPEDKAERDRAIKVFETLENQRFYYKNEFGEPARFKFSIESECALTPKYLVSKSLDILIDKFNTLATKVDKYDIHTINEEQNLHAITIQEDDHTLGNLLATFVYDNYVRPKKNVTFVGYNMPHPLEHYIVLKIRFSANTNVAEFVREVCGMAINQLQTLKSQWHEFANLPAVPGSQQPPKAAVRKVVVRKPVAAK